MTSYGITLKVEIRIHYMSFLIKRTSLVHLVCSLFHTATAGVFSANQYQCLFTLPYLRRFNGTGGCQLTIDNNFGALS